MNTTNDRLLQPVAALMIGLTLFGTFSQIATARAAEPHTAGLTYNFTLDIPNHGVIDLYHNAYTSRDRISNSLYVLRNAAVEDLLNTRRSIKVLLGGTEGARKASNKKDLSFDVPGGVVDLYLLGNLSGKQNYTSRLEKTDSSPLPGPVKPRFGIDTDSIPEIAYAVHWLGSHEPKYDEVLRTRLLMGLVYVSAELTKYDQQLKFLQKDFWNDHAIDMEFYNSEIRDWELSVLRAGGDSNPKVMYDHAMHQWLPAHGMTEVLSVLAGHRDYLLDRYHLLGLEIDGKPLYQVIYEKMESVGFPRADLVQAPVIPHLPSGKENIPMPDGFDKASDAAFNVVLGEHQNEILSELSLFLNPKINEALVASLEANTERLTALTSVIDYDGDRSSPLLELARFEDLWKVSAKKYEYLSGVIDFNGAQNEIQSYFERVDKTKRNIRYTAYGVGIGLGIAAAVFSGGTAAEAGAAAVEGGETAVAAASWLGIPLRTWLFGAGAIVTNTQANLDYVDSEQAALVSKGLFLGTTNQGDYQNMLDTVASAKVDQNFRTVEAFTTLVGGLTILGAEPKVIAMLAKGRTLVQSGGKTLVRLSAEELATTREAVQALAKRAEALAPMGRAILAVVREILGVTIGFDNVMAMEEAIPMVARQMRLAPAVVRARILANPMVGKLVQGLEQGVSARGQVAKILGKPSFWRTVVLQETTQVAVSVVTESLDRGKHVYSDQLGDAVLDTIEGAAVTFILVYNGSPSNILGAQEEASAAAAGIKYVPKVIVNGGFKDTKLGQVYERAKFNFIAGVIVNGATSLPAEAFQFVQTRNDPNAPTLAQRAESVGKNTLYGGLFTGISSTARYELMSWIGNNINKAVANKSTANIIMSTYSGANNLFGGWTYVNWGKGLGFLADGKPVTPNLDDSRPLDPRINGLQIESPQGAYLRIEGDDTNASSMFDFLQHGDDAGPAPIAK